MSGRPDGSIQGHADRKEARMSDPYMPRDFETMANVLESAYGAGANRGVAAEMLRQGGAQAAEIDRLTQRWEALTTFIDDCTSVDVKVIQDEIDRLERKWVE